jgi:hypothetical protein
VDRNAAGSTRVPPSGTVQADHSFQRGLRAALEGCPVLAGLPPAAHFPQEPGPGQPPVPGDCLLRDIQHLCCFCDGQPSKEAQLYDPTFSFINFSDYTISGSPIGNNSVVRVNSKDGSVSVSIVTYGSGSARKQAGSYLVFNRYGDRYFLSEIWNASVNVGRQLARSPAEREFAPAPPALAASGRHSQELVVLRVR